MDVELAVVTGGARGLGRFITQRLAERGLCVVIADTDQAAGAQLVTELHDRGRQAIFVDTDAADAEAIEQLMSRTADLGTLRVLVNNASGWLPGPQYPEAMDWRRSIDLNLVMPMLAAQLAVPWMINSGGSIINVSSSGGRIAPIMPRTPGSSAIRRNAAAAHRRADRKISAVRPAPVRGR